MIFNSLTFLIFLVTVVTLFWVLPQRIRLWMLLIASCVFYGFWRWEYLSVMFVSAITDYYTSLAIYNTPVENKKRRKSLLYITLFVNLGLLMFFKYLYFFTDNTNTLLFQLGSHYQLPLLKLVLPFGISFYTFETISYTVDVYRGLIVPEKKFLNYGLFVTFFPKLVAGPIQRAAELMEQLKTRTKFDADFIIIGVKRILYGLFLKVLIADNISPMVDEGFLLNPSTLGALDVWVLAFMFGFQIYFDFAAYSHIALGTAKLMGINIPENFNFPYISSSMKDFWKRWHISLSSWIRDYLYLPLTGAKVITTTGKGGIGDSLEGNVSQNKKNKALFLTWIIMGFWHGANWTFAFWGLYHAALIFTERLLKPFRKKVKFLEIPFIGWCITLPLVMLSWIPFRAKNLTDTFIMFGKVLKPAAYKTITISTNNYLSAASVMLIFIATYFATTYIEPKLEQKPILAFSVNVIKFTVIILAVFTFLRPISQFIYFQF